MTSRVPLPNPEEGPDHGVTHTVLLPVVLPPDPPPPPDGGDDEVTGVTGVKITDSQAIRLILRELQYSRSRSWWPAVRIAIESACRVLSALFSAPVWPGKFELRNGTVFLAAVLVLTVTVLMTVMFGADRVWSLVVALVEYATGGVVRAVPVTPGSPL